MSQSGTLRPQFEATNELKATLDGLLLSDGWVGAHPRGVNASYTHSCKHYEYTNFVKMRLEDFGIAFTGKSADKIYRIHSKKFDTTHYQAHSAVHPFLTEQRQRWYKEKVKIVPADLVVHPLTALHWFLGDGTVHRSYGELRGLNFCTQSFTRIECDRLSSLLESMNFTSSVRTQSPGKFYVAIWVASCIDFLDYIGPCPVACYQYKWDAVFSSRIRSQV